MKQRYVYGVDAPTSSTALTDAEAFSGTDAARIGFHNDCFLSSPNDYGTYDDYGNSSSPSADAYSFYMLMLQQMANMSLLVAKLVMILTVLKMIVKMPEKHKQKCEHAL